MWLIFDKVDIPIRLYDSEVAEIIQNTYTHLQHLPLPWHPSDSPTYQRDFSIGQRVFALWQQARSINVDVDVARCLRSDQSHFNDLHAIFIKNHVAGNDWLNYHDLLHACESRQQSDALRIDYREYAELLRRPFRRDWLKLKTTKVYAGQVYCAWAELGKTPYIYWVDQEPNDISRILQLVKPWTKLRPTLWIALSDIDFEPKKDISDFEKWWSQYNDTWCSLMGIDTFSTDENFSVIPVGEIDNLDALVHEIKSNHSVPCGIKMNGNQDGETLDVEITFRCQWTTHAPNVEIFVDQTSLGMHTLSQGVTKTRHRHMFTPGEHTIKILRRGATSDDCSQMVTIEKIMIGNIDCDQLIFKHSYFMPEYPEPWATEQRSQGIELSTKIPFETWLGHDGEWCMPITSPFYPAFLDSIPRQS